MGYIIDVSQWQGQIDWSKASKEVDLAILRASCGTSADTRFQEYAKGCQKYGVPFGVYHYLMGGSEAAILNEIKVFYNTAKTYRPSFWVLDVEDPALLYANGKSLPMKTSFHGLVTYAYNELRKRVGSTGKIVFYGGESVYEPYGRMSTIPWDALWIAAYGKNTGKVSSTPKMAHDLHQYTSKGRISGINTNVDLSRLMGSKPLSWWTSGKAEEQQGAAQTIDANADGKIVEITEPTSWNIRELPDATSRLTGLVAQVGEKYEWAATAWNGWLGVFLSDGSIGWISNKAGKVVDAK